MGRTLDIRSFFGGGTTTAPPAKKRRVEKATDEEAKITTPSVTTHASIENGVDVVTPAPTIVQKEIVEPKQQDEQNKASSDTEVAAAEEVGKTDISASDAAPLVHSYQNLQLNLKVLMHLSWYNQLEKEFKRPYFLSLVRFLQKEESSKKTIYPPPQDVFATLRDCTFDSLKVVILGQDPYHGPEQAHGLSFSVRKGIPPPPSLRNIYKEAMADVKIRKPTHGCLSSWNKQGVLLLNAVLTVRRGEANSHKKQGWETFTDAVIQRINAHAENVVFLLWGKPAQEKCAIIDPTKHFVLKSSHPSPLGATKTAAPFIGSKCFSKANAYLIKHGKDPIDWNVV